ncbi:hypothetical protein B0T25DRAFT_548395 [Lasiosphaeria hispida]|uniref:Secreted protein n=1 Tax=Lasiosphaeria hispida TaxID=260671 RepID=A0AAJ0HF76_9PEZI|nr:hypothetical protein B0T25DRAFT_548395 [Lasiosphaeria hispida]
MRLTSSAAVLSALSPYSVSWLAVSASLPMPYWETQQAGRRADARRIRNSDDTGSGSIALRSWTGAKSRSNSFAWRRMGATAWYNASFCATGA